MDPTCKELRPALGGRDDLPEAEIEAHLSACVACRLASSGFERLDSLLFAEAAGAEPIVPESVMANVRAEVARRRGLEARWSRAWSPAAVAVAAFLVCGLLALAELGGWQAPAEQVAATLGWTAFPESLGLGLDLSGLWSSVSLSVPAPSLALLLVGCVVVAAFNVALCRVPRLSREVR